MTKDVSHLTKASFLNGVGNTTPLFSRLSTVTYGREFPDTGRNPRGFALKFYTDVCCRSYFDQGTHRLGREL